MIKSDLKPGRLYSYADGANLSFSGERRLIGVVPGWVVVRRPGCGPHLLTLRNFLANATPKSVQTKKKL